MADNGTFVNRECNKSSVHSDYGLCMNSFRLITYECITHSTTVQKTDIETFVIKDDNRHKQPFGLHTEDNHSEGRLRYPTNLS